MSATSKPRLARLFADQSDRLRETADGPAPAGTTPDVVIPLRDLDDELARELRGMTVSVPDRQVAGEFVGVRTEGEDVVLTLAQTSLTLVAPTPIHLTARAWAESGEEGEGVDPDLSAR